MNFTLHPVSENTPRPRAIIFDWDNTLIDSWGVIHHALIKTFEAMDMPTWDIAQTKERVRHSLRDSFPLLFGDRWEQAREFYYQHFEQSHLAQLKALEGAEKLLKQCHEQSIPMAIISNKTGRYLRKEVAALGWEGYFLSVLGAGDAVRDKPDPVVIEQTLGLLSVPAGPDIWFVGDTDVDLICAANGGCLPVFVGDAAEIPIIDGVGAVSGLVFNGIGCICDHLSFRNQFC